jgi:hypothetical protein
MDLAKSLAEIGDPVNERSIFLSVLICHSIHPPFLSACP